MQVADEIEETVQPVVVIHDVDNDKVKELEQDIHMLHMHKKSLTK